MIAEFPSQPESTVADAQQADRNVCPTPRARRAWTPSRDEHDIYWWVRFQGQSQAEIANSYGIHQGTVSRIIERYERWQVREAQRAEGRLDPEERLRAQRWLTYERNEQILASCLRIADKTEGFVDASKSTTQHPDSYSRAERQVRTEHFAIDRTGMVSRFLRLAFKVNMEQLKLVKEVEPPLPPLAEEELAAEEQAAAAAQAEIEQARQERRNIREEEDRRRREHQQQLNAELQAQAEAQFRQRRVAELVRQREEAEERGQATDSGAGFPACQGRQECLPHTDEGDYAHNAHIAEEPETAVTDASACTCDENVHAVEIPKPVRMNGQPAIAELRLTPAKPPQVAAVHQ